MPPAAPVGTVVRGEKGRKERKWPPVVAAQGEPAGGERGPAASAPEGARPRVEGGVGRKASEHQV